MSSSSEMTSATTPDARFPDRAARYLDTPSMGLPPRSVVEALREASVAWAEYATYLEWEAAAERTREALAVQRGVAVDSLGLVPSVTTPFAAAAAPFRDAGGDVVAHRAEFRSLLLPFLAAVGEQRMRWVDGAYDASSFVDRIEDGVVAVLVSSVASHDGSRPDLAVIIAAADAVGARVYVDSTQSEGIVELGVPYEACAMVAAAAYKGLLMPRGTGFVIAPASTPLRAVAPSPYGMADGGERGSYGPPVVPFSGGRGLDQSPAWLGWAAGEVALRAVAPLRDAVQPHAVGLADALRDALEAGGVRVTRGDLPSPIVSAPVADADAAVAALNAAGVRGAIRIGRVRLGTHVYVAEAAVEDAAAALLAAPGALRKEP